MKTDEENKLEQNALAERLKSIASRAKEGRVSNLRIGLLVVALIAILGVWWYLRSVNRKSEAEMWLTFDNLRTAEEFNTFAEGHTNSIAGRAARLQQARILLAQGVVDLTAPSLDAEARKKTINNVTQARDEFVKLADEFKGDITLRAQALDGAAKAELALVGIPTSDTSTSLTETRGSVAKAVEYYREYAKTVGEQTPRGEEVLKKAADLEKNAAQIQTLGSTLNSQFSPKKLTDEPKLPDSLKGPGGLFNQLEPAAPGKVETPAPTTPNIPPPTTPSTPTPPETPPAGEKK